MLALIPLLLGTFDLNFDRDSIRRTVEYLASPELSGRMTLSPGADRAAWYIERQFRLDGLTPGGSDGFFYTYHTRFVEREKGKRRVAEGFAKDVIGLSPGTDPQLKQEWIVIGAHYDHLGYGEIGSRSGSFVIHPGADDNASGTAGVVALAKYFSTHPHRHPIAFESFSGEEEGLLGSEAWVKNHPKEVKDIDAMINMDMVGRLRNGKLYIFGTSSSTGWDSVLSNTVLNGLDVAKAGNVRGDSDQAPFAQAKVPVIEFFTGLHEEYHTEKDTPDTINYEGEASVLEMVVRTVEALDAAPRLTFNPKVVMGNMAHDRDINGKSEGPGGQTRRILVGFVPDMGDNGPGVLITGTTKDSPAEKAGFKTGDRILEFNGVKLADLGGLADAMRTAKPGDTVKIVYQREGKRLELMLTVAERKGG